MKLFLRATALSMSCLLLTAASCEKKVVASIPTPPERLICDPAGSRPTIPSEYVIDWLSVPDVLTAQSEVKKLMTSIRTREGIVAGYLVNVEGKLFTCFNNMQWRREFEADLNKSE